MTDFRRVSPAEARSLVEQGYHYVDVRTELEFEQGHPEGAFNVPIALSVPNGMSPNPDFVAVVTARFGKNAPLIVGCKAGGRSARAAQALVAAGFTDVVDQRAGFDGARDPFGAVVEPGWSRVDLPVGTGSPPGRSYADLKASSSG